MPLPCRFSEGQGESVASMRVILIAIGSLGDTLPFIALGRSLLRRGHEVILGGNSHFAGVIEKHGLQFAEIFPAEDYRRFLEHYRTWSLRESVAEGTRLMRAWMEKSHELIVRKTVPGMTVVASVGCAFGARIAQETHGIPLATVHLQPMWMRSVHDGTCLPPWFPPSFFRAVEGTVDLLIDRGLGEVTNGYRASFGLRPVKRLMRSWWHSPQMVLNLFPAWFSAPQPDWPANSICAGFPRTDDLHDEHSELVEHFLDGGDRPIVFAQSSIGADEEFFAIGREISRKLGRRAIFVMPNGSRGERSEEFLQVPFLRLDRVLSRCAALVHHGGIGTIASALTAGVCQITIPTLPDQIDNSRRLRRLGVAEMFRRKDYSAARGAKVLGRLLTSDETRDRCRLFAERAAADDGLARACDSLESLMSVSLSSGIVATPSGDPAHVQAAAKVLPDGNLVAKVDKHGEC